MQKMFICKGYYVRIGPLRSIYLGHYCGLLLTNEPAYGYRRGIIDITYERVLRTIMDRDQGRKEQLKNDGILHPNPDRVRTDLLERSVFFDACDLMQMKYEMLRSVSVDQKSVAEAARMFGLSRVAYYHARKQYQEEGLVGLMPRRRGPKHPHKFTPEVISFVDEQLALTEGRPDWNLLSKRIEAEFGTKVHPRSVERAVKQKRGPQH